MDSQGNAMERIHEHAAYVPAHGNFWADTVDHSTWPELTQDLRVDVAVIGGGFTGLNAALRAAQGGARVAVLDAHDPGFGASGRNGGFCCLGGAKMGAAQIARRFGATQLDTWRAAERAAVDHVAGQIKAHGWQVDAHSQGETLLAHTPRAFARMRAEMPAIARAHGVTAQILPRDALAEHGLRGNFHGAATLPIGFALNPAKLHAGLCAATHAAGAALHGHSPVLDIQSGPQGWLLRTPKARVHAARVILATNGYSSENLPGWLRGRYLPVLSNIIVTHPLTEDERAAQGWTSGQMAFDTRFLLHYFRLMPDGRFLFGMRGGLRATPVSSLLTQMRIRRNFSKLFPEWRHVPITHEWSGLVCLMPGRVPFCGEVPGHPGFFAALGFHGNGVAMGSYLGAHVGALAVGQPPEGPAPEFLRHPPRRMPLGRRRRLLMAPVYSLGTLLDL